MPRSVRNNIHRAPRTSTKTTDPSANPIAINSRPARSSNRASMIATIALRYRWCRRRPLCGQRMCTSFPELDAVI
jgi:hypothetical protein